MANPVNTPELMEFAKFSIIPKTRKMPEKMFSGKMVNMYDNSQYERHTFISVGTPANCIEKIIVSNTQSKECILKIKELLAKYNLECKIYNSEGILQ